MNRRTTQKLHTENEPGSLGDDLNPPSAEGVGAPPRVDENRNADADYRRASTLEAPPARKGFVQMWIRTESNGKPDGRNVARKFREGWTPRPLDSVPEGISPPTIKHGHQTVIGVEGMILCEMPKALAAKRRLAIKQRTDRQMEAVEQNIMRTERPGRPIDRTFKSTVGVGKRATAADD